MSDSDRTGYSVSGNVDQRIPAGTGVLQAFLSREEPCRGGTLGWRRCRRGTGKERDQTVCKRRGGTGKRHLCRARQRRRVKRGRHAGPAERGGQAGDLRQRRAGRVSAPLSGSNPA